MYDNLSSTTTWAWHLWRRLQHGALIPMLCFRNNRHDHCKNTLLISYWDWLIATVFEAARLPQSRWRYPRYHGTVRIRGTVLRRHRPFLLAAISCCLPAYQKWAQNSKVPHLSPLNDTRSSPNLTVLRISSRSSSLSKERTRRRWRTKISTFLSCKYCGGFGHDENYFQCDLVLLVQESRDVEEIKWRVRWCKPREENLGSDQVQRGAGVPVLASYHQRRLEDSSRDGFTMPRVVPKWGRELMGSFIPGGVSLYLILKNTQSLQSLAHWLL